MQKELDRYLLPVLRKKYKTDLHLKKVHLSYAGDLSIHLFFVGLQLMLTEQQIQIRNLIYREKLSDFPASRKLTIQKMNSMLMSHVARVH